MLIRLLIRGGKTRKDAKLIVQQIAAIHSKLLFRFGNRYTVCNNDTDKRGVSIEYASLFCNYDQALIKDAIDILSNLLKNPVTPDATYTHPPTPADVGAILLQLKRNDVKHPSHEYLLLKDERKSSPEVVKKQFGDLKKILAGEMPAPMKYNPVTRELENC